MYTSPGSSLALLKLSMVKDESLSFKKNFRFFLDYILSNTLKMNCSKTKLKIKRQNTYLLFKLLLLISQI